jgi:hypothetical protein
MRRVYNWVHMEPRPGWHLPPHGVLNELQMLCLMLPYGLWGCLPPPVLEDLCIILADRVLEWPVYHLFASWQHDPSAWGPIGDAGGAVIADIIRTPIPNWLDIREHLEVVYLCRHYNITYIGPRSTMTGLFIGLKTAISNNYMTKDLVYSFGPGHLPVIPSSYIPCRWVPGCDWGGATYNWTAHGPAERPFSD